MFCPKCRSPQKKKNGFRRGIVRRVYATHSPLLLLNNCVFEILILKHPESEGLEINQTREESGSLLQTMAHVVV